MAHDNDKVSVGVFFLVFFGVMKWRAAAVQPAILSMAIAGKGSGGRPGRGRGLRFVP